MSAALCMTNIQGSNQQINQPVPMKYRGHRVLARIVNKKLDNSWAMVRLV
jgi:hypothetical protein